MLPPDTLYKLAITQLKGMNMEIVRALIEAAGSIESLFEITPQKWAEAVGLRKNILSPAAIDKALAFAKEELAFLEKSVITPLFFTDSNYPSRLLECVDAPLLLYYRGEANLNSSKIISVVGTRHATNYGRGFCEKFMKELAEMLPDTLIVSGLAYGIDVCAHRSAMANNLPTVGVLAHGLHTIYPASHRQTAIEMLRHGGLLTEYSSQSFTSKGSFVARNRIVAGIADATIVIESADKGGALITAGIASSYDRDLFALPGRVGDPYSAGCNQLIAQNRAVMICSAQQFVEQMCWLRSPKESLPFQPSLFTDLDAEEQLVLNVLIKRGECQINALCIATNMPTAKLLPMLVEMEFKGVVTAFPGGVYRPA